MVVFLKVLRFQNSASHSFWGYLTDKTSQLIFFQESLTSLSQFLSKHSKDTIVTFDGEYLFGKYSHLINPSSVIALDVFFYLTEKQKFSIGNFCYKNKECVPDDMVFFDHRQVTPHEMITDELLKNYVSQYCELTRRFMTSKNADDLVSDLLLDNKVQLFYQNIQPKICENVYRFNSQPILFDSSLKFTKKLLKNYEDYITKIRRLGNKVYSNYNSLSILTGRLGCSGDLNPMLLPKEIRSLIKPKNDFLVSLDAKSAEPNMIFELSDSELDRDDIYGSIIDAMDGSIDRDSAKSLWFNFVYGNSAVRQSSDIRKMEDAFPEIASFVKKLVERSKKEHTMYNFFGRRLPRIDGSDYKIVSHYVQSTFSDFFQLIVNQASRVFEEKSLKSRVICTIHDELLLDIKREEQDSVVEIIQEATDRICDDFGFSRDVMVFKSTILKVV